MSRASSLCGPVYFHKGINKTDSVKSLGVHIDDHLAWSVHIDILRKKKASAIGALKRIIFFCNEYGYLNLSCTNSTSFLLLLLGLG